MNPFRMDPSRTFLIRGAFDKDVRRRFSNIVDSVMTEVGHGDAFRVRSTHSLDSPTGRLKQFNRWFERKLDEEVLQSNGLGTVWTDRYTVLAYRRGVSRALEGVPTKLRSHFSSPEDFLRSFVARPKSRHNIDLLTARVEHNLREIASRLSAQASRIFADGLSRGMEPVQVANEIRLVALLTLERRGRILAQTEVIRNHAEGQLDAFAYLDVPKVGVEVEWQTTGKPCPFCLEKVGVYTIEDARGLIPLHPACLCCWGMAA